jgi:hemolysin activation/secretion protein
MHLRLTIPFEIRGQSFRFSTSWRQQQALNKLIHKDRLNIGGRYTVRGFDGEYTLSGDHGFVSRSELAYAVPKIKQELYVACDVGRVWGPNADALLGQSLSGAALGLRGAIKNFSYDAHVSKPINAPDGYPGKNWVYGFTANLQF